MKNTDLIFRFRLETHRPRGAAAAACDDGKRSGGEGGERHAYHVPSPSMVGTAKIRLWCPTLFKNLVCACRPTKGSKRPSVLLSRGLFLEAVMNSHSRHARRTSVVAVRLLGLAPPPSKERKEERYREKPSPSMQPPVLPCGPTVALVLYLHTCAFFYSLSNKRTACPVCAGGLSVSLPTKHAHLAALFRGRG